MAHSVSARKRIRQNSARNIQNKAKRSRFRTEIKRMLEFAAKGEFDAAQKAMPAAMKSIDKAAKTLAIHRNAAARYKSRLHAVLARAQKAAASKPVVAAKPTKAAAAKAGAGKGTATKASKGK